MDIKVWWMDADWYAKVDKNQSGFSVGNWVPDPERFPSKFKDISDYANENGVKTLLWFEPERISITTKQYAETPDTEYRVKPEWLIGYGEAGKVRLPTVLRATPSSFDLGNKEAFDWLVDRVSTIIKEGGISIYREDLNINSIDDTWAAQLGSPRPRGNERKRLRHGTLCLLGRHSFAAADRDYRLLRLGRTPSRP